MTDSGKGGDGSILAAGAVVFRGDREIPEFLLLRNSLHLTWAPPKGHLEVGETREEGARRELREELGEEAFLVFEEGFTETIHYPVNQDGRSRTKSVTWYLARLVDGGVRLSAEHDAKLWAGLDTALATLQHDDLRGVVSAAAAFLKPGGLKRGGA